MIFRSGQITVLVLLLSLLGLTTVLSVASRSLSDLRQVTRVDIGTKTFAAAEAGLEYALNDYTQNKTASCLTQTATLSIAGMQPITYTICSNNADYAKQLNVPKDDVFQVDLTGVPANLKVVDVLWSNSASSVLVDMIDTSNAISRFNYNPVGSTLTNGFATASDISNCLTSTCNDPAFSTWTGCVGSTLTLRNTRLIRIRPVYSNTDIAVCGRTSGNSPGRLNAQVVVITVTATSTDGTVKKLQATRYPPYISTLFDNVLFTKGTIVK